MSEKRKVLITGGCGFVGTPTVLKLVDSGFHPIVFDNLSRGSVDRIGDLVRSGSASFIEGDIRDAHAVKLAIGESLPWGIIHLAAVHFIPYCRANPAETIETNVLGLQNVLDAASGVRRLIFSSTVDVYAPSNEPHSEDSETTPDNIYGASKLMGEQLIRFWRSQGSDVQPVIARLSNVVGPGETNPHILPDVCDYMRESDVLPLGNVEPRRDYVFVNDVAHALVALLDSDVTDEVVNVSTGVSHSVTDLIDAIRRVTGRNLVIDSDPTKIRKVDRPVLAVDVTKLRRLVPGATSTNLDNAIRALLESEALLG